MREGLPIAASRGHGGGLSGGAISDPAPWSARGHAPGRADRLVSTMGHLSDLEIALRIPVAILLGGLIGLEREIKGHVAGLRTNMLVCLGSTLFMIAGELLAARYSALAPISDPTRIASTIVQGIGFLGAGVIFQSGTRVRGLTTAASIWVVAAVGVLVGSGLYLAAVTGTAITVVVLALLPTVEDWIASRRRPGLPEDTARDVAGEERQRGR